jgi:hypothetical protein
MPLDTLITSRAKRLWDLYRLTEADYDQILNHQNGVCAISGRLPGATRLHTDHDHQTGLIRGLLSPFINKGLAYFEDDPYLLRQAADYLENPPAVAALGRRVYGLLGRAKHKKTMVYGPKV